MNSKGLEKLVFEEKDLDTFTKGIVPLVKEEIVVEKSVKKVKNVSRETKKKK